MGWLFFLLVLAAFVAAAAKLGDKSRARTSEVRERNGSIPRVAVRNASAAIIRQPSRLRDKPFPARVPGGVAPAPMPSCKLYFPTYSALNSAQQRYFVYWRDAYESGRVLDADATYRFLYVYELAVEARSAEELERLWTQLYRATDTKDTVAGHLACWIVDLRLLRNANLYDDITVSCREPALSFDLAVRAGVAPPAETFWGLQLPLTCDADLRRRVQRMLGNVDTSAILEAAAGRPPPIGKRMLFSGLGWPSDSLRRFGPLTVELPRYSQMSDVRHAVLGVINAVLELSGTAPLRSASHRGAVASTAPVAAREQTERIVTRALDGLPNVASLEGLLWTVERVLDDSVLVLLLLVLWLAEVKPYIEGRITFSGELRGHYEMLGGRLGLPLTIGSLRNDFWMLSHGARAVWTIDPTAATVNDIKTGLTAARFTRAMQHLLVGSAARAKVVHTLCKRLGQRRRTSSEQVRQVLAEATGTSPTIQ